MQIQFQDSCQHAVRRVSEFGCLGPPCLRDEHPQCGILLHRTAEPEPLMRFWLMYGALETSLTQQLPAFCRSAACRVVRFEEKAVGVKSRLTLGFYKNVFLPIN